MVTSTLPHRTEPAILLRALRLLLWVGGAGIVAWALLDPRFRDAEGFVRGAFCLPVSAGVALAILGWAAGSRLRQFGFWLALALLGQAAALQLVEAGALVRWQHYEPLGSLLTAANVPILLLLGVQAVVVAAGLAVRWPRIRAWLSSSFRTWQVLAIAGVFVASSAAGQRDFRLYVGDLVVAAFVQSVSLGNVVLMAWALPEDALGRLQGWLDRLLGRLGERDSAETGGVDRVALFAALWVTALASLLGYLSYEWHPHITDEVAYLYQARLLAEGTITAPAPPVPEAFDVYLMEFKGDRWYPATPPGWPAMLAVGARLGVPGLVNPVLAGVNVLLAYLLLRDLYDRRGARLAALLLASSPWFVLMGMNYMTHTFTLTCALAAAVAVIQARRTGRTVWGGLAGVAVGVGTLIRPLDGLIVGGLIGLWAIGVGGQRMRLSAIAAFVVGAILAGAAVLPFNQALTGSPTTFPLNAYLDSHFGPGRNDLGFGPNRGFGWPIQPFTGHSPLGALINANLNTFSINVELFGWGTGSLLLVLIALFSGPLRRSDYLMIAVCLAVFWPYFFYYFSGGPDFGARYWFLMLVPLVALTVRGIHLLQRRLSQGTGSPRAGGARVMVAVLSLSLLTLVSYFPWRAVDKYHHYWGMRPDVVSLARAHAFGKSLVLIRANESHPDFASAAIYNPLDWQADAPVYAWDRGPEVRARLLGAFPDRPVWIVDGPSLTLQGYRVVEGPLSAQAVLARDRAAEAVGR